MQFENVQTTKAPPQWERNTLHQIASKQFFISTTTTFNACVSARNDYIWLECRLGGPKGTSDLSTWSMFLTQTDCRHVSRDDSPLFPRYAQPLGCLWRGILPFDWLYRLLVSRGIFGCVKLAPKSVRVVRMGSISASNRYMPSAYYDFHARSSRDNTTTWKLPSAKLKNTCMVSPRCAGLVCILCPAPEQNWTQNAPL